MKVLQFSLSTLQFHNTTLEDKYQEYILEEKLTYFRLLMSITILNTLVSLFRSIIEEWGTFLIISLSVQTALYFIKLIFSRKISPYFKYILPLLYVIQYTFFIIGALNNLLQPHYVYGFIGGIFSSCMLNYLSVKIKIVILLSSIWILLGVFRIYSLININYILLGIGATSLQMFSAYIFEYNSRLNFSQGMIIKQQINLMYEYTSQKILIVSFNKNKTFFELDFVNQKFESFYKIENNQDKVKEFLRNHLIINLATHQMFGSLKVQKFANKQITLEDLLFEKYRAQKNFGEEFNSFQIIDQNKKQKEIQVQIINGLKTLFLIIIKENNNDIQIEKYEKKIQMINNQSTNFSILVGSKLQSIYKSIFDLEIYQYETQALNKIQGSIQYILNESKNQLMFFSQNKIHQLIDRCLLSTFILALKPYFIYQCQQSKIQFELLFQMDKDNVQMKVNTKQLTQILINIFNKILTYSQSNSTILLRISKEYNLNPLSNSQQKQSSSSKFDYLCSSQENSQLLIIFNFTFKTDDEINNFERCFINQDNELEQKDDLITIVNSYILKQLSPYNKIFIIQEKISRSQNNTLKFYIYSDQTQIDPSYCKSIKQQNIID
ncbi:unnamed protein product [Paramecium pentaurelia]|uniref:Transmembrane protein n=1 Tax=Paramecium pentaurelia TaxID=43138 RepID=A0A8S1XH95_9CILI|nr:unnamed protein product [Paramecium pentaurelia]